IVLSPMEPVAPSTVTERTAVAALLLRKGTALIPSPNHKTAANAIRAAPQKAEKCRQNDGGDEAVKTVHKPAMARCKPADPARPGLFRTDLRPEFGSADQPAGEVSSDIGRPDHQQHQQQRRESPERIKPHCAGADGRRQGIADSNRAPEPAIGRQKRNGENSQTN